MRIAALWRLIVSTVKRSQAVDAGGADALNAGDDADSCIAAREPKQMLDKLPLVNLKEFKLEVADMVTNRLSS